MKYWNSELKTNAGDAVESMEEGEKVDYYKIKIL